MTPWPRWPAAWLLLGLLSAQLISAQEPGYQALIDSDITAWAYQYSASAFVSSIAKATLYGPNGRLYEEINLNHKVENSNNHRIRYQEQFVSPNGYANSVTGIMDVEFGCYISTAVAHANAYNLHSSEIKGPACTDYVHVGGEPPPPPPKENCPILLDLRLDGFHLSGPNPPVHFDIDADGDAEEIAWTEAGGNDAFLCWDRNHNGAIDDGRELFGYATPLASGKPAKVGYRALEELDGPELGGNQDGKVDVRDAMFGELCAWTDANRDGVSQADEIRSLPEVRVVALEYRYKPTRLRDQYGNLFRYVSSTEMRLGPGNEKSWPTYDVIFAEP